jgi:UPF0755 protein
VALSRSSKGFLAVCLAIVLGIGGALLYFDGRLGGLGQPQVEPGQAVEIEVPPGTSVRALGNELAERGVVRRSGSFVNAASNERLDQQLQPGGYDLETGMSSEDAVQVFLEGPVRRASIRFTIPEGWAVERILDRLDEAFEDHGREDFEAVLEERIAAGENTPDGLQLPDWFPEPAEAGDEVVEPFEGAFFPETYEVGLDATPRDALQRMLDQTATVMERVLEETGADIDPYELLVIASLIERETFVGEERPRIAGVISNRLDDGMRLQIDATVLYARGEHTERVLYEDTEIDSPYNTYQVTGLPPTPIAAPGEAALRATVEPEEHDLFFYVLHPDCDGSHQFAQDESGHHQNVSEFRAADRCQ